MQIVMVNRLPPSPILFVDHAQQLGGAEHSLLLLMQHLDATKWQPHLASPSGALAVAAQQQGTPYHPVSLPRLKRSAKVGMDWLQGARRLADIAQAVEADLLVANTVRAAFYTALAAKLCKRPFLWHMRDFWLGESKPRFSSLDQSIKKMICISAAHVVANSYATAAQLPCANVSVVHNGIDLTKFVANNEAGVSFRQTHSIPQNVPLVGIVGRLRRWKGQHRFIEMAVEVAAVHPTVHFAVVGGDLFKQDNGYTNYLARITNESRLAHKIHFTGHLDNVHHAFSAIDIFVHAGDPEPFGLVNIEAMAATLPVVAFSHGALPEIVAHDETGLLVPPYDVPVLARAVNDLPVVPKRALAMGHAGRDRVKECFTIQQTAENITTLLQKTLGRNG